MYICIRFANIHKFIIMFRRQISDKLLYLASKYPVVTLTGPRQTGKTTLVKTVFPDYNYVNLENPARRSLAIEDPNSFIEQYSQKTIIDEVQYAPDLLSYIQEKVDETGMAGHFIITGSQNLQLIENVTQSLAGRTTILKLLPLSLSELITDKDLNPKPTYSELVFNGFFPGKYKHDINSTDFYQSYFETYIQRDVRQIKNIVNLDLFANFVRLCAGRIGQIVDLSSLASDAGVSVNTVKGWLSLLQAAYIVILLQPYYKNLNKRIIKSPKLYFSDTGLASFLLNITDQSQIDTHYLKGGLFENMIFLELLKNRLNNGLLSNIYYYRDSNKNEVDFILEETDKLRILEVKSGQTFSSSFLKPLDFWKRNFTHINAQTFLIYGGKESQRFKDHSIVSWKQLSLIYDDITLP